MLKPKYKPSEGVTFSWPGVSNRPSSLPFTPTNTLKCWLNRNNQSWKSLLRLININASNLLSGKWLLSGLNIRPATLKIRLLVISKLLTISSNCGLRSSAGHDSVVQLLIWNEMNSGANIAGHLSIGPIVNV